MAALEPKFQPLNIRVSSPPQETIRGYEFLLSEVLDVFKRAERQLLHLKCQMIPEHHLSLWNKRMNEANRRMKWATYKSENAQLAVLRVIGDGKERWLGFAMTELRDALRYVKGIEYDGLDFRVGFGEDVS